MNVRRLLPGKPRRPVRQLTAEAGRTATRHVVTIEEYDHDCAAGHGADCVPTTSRSVTVWTLPSGDQVTQGPTFDQLERRYGEGVNQ